MLAEKNPNFYINPVYPHSFPDPFVFKFRGEYYALCTDFARDGKVFPVLHSRDLVNWREIGGAMEKLNNDSPFYWAPEVFYHNGKFYLYYSVGNEAQMEIRVAVSTRPDGSFIDSGHRLTGEEFAIDAHVFEDTNGEHYLFYATDFLAHSHIGTGTVVDKLIDFFTLAGAPRPVTRARYDWQIYDPNRAEKGGVRWHTVEGPTVLKRKNVYYEMFSGGNWQNTTYGVSFAVTGDLNQTEEWSQFSDGEKVFPILRTIPDLIVGPGHNSVVRGLNNRELFCVYHRWTENGRVLAIDRMDFTGGNRMFIKGATHTPQLAPYQPGVSDFFDELSENRWQKIARNWRASENELICENSENSQENSFGEVVCRQKTENFMCEISLRNLENSSGAFGVCLKNGSENILRFLLSPKNCAASVIWRENGIEQNESFSLPKDFDFSAFHLLRIEIDCRRVKIKLDENTIRVERMLEIAASQIALAAESSAAFSGFSLTEGFEELFETDHLPYKGWNKAAESGEIYVEDQILKIVSGNDAPTILSKKLQRNLENNYELTVNFCLSDSAENTGAFEFYPIFDEKKGANQSCSFSIQKESDKWFLLSKSVDAVEKTALPEQFSPQAFHQIRFIKLDEKIRIEFETQELCSIKAPANVGGIAFGVINAAVSFDMVRLTIFSN